MSENKESLHEATRRLFIADAEIKANIAKMGDLIGEREGYRTARGMEAVYRYLIDKYHWLPADVRALSVEDLSLLLDDVR